MPVKLKITFKLCYTNEAALSSHDLERELQLGSSPKDFNKGEKLFQYKIRIWDIVHAYIELKSNILCPQIRLINN